MVTESRKMKATGLLTNEVQNGSTLARSYDFLGRPTGYTLRDSAPPREVSCSYDSLGRLSTVASGTNADGDVRVARFVVASY